MTTHNSFFVCLPSNTIHPSRNNKTSHYYVNMPSTLLLTGEWEVALVEVNVPISWYDLPEDPARNRTITMERNEFNKKTGIKKIKSMDDIITGKRYKIKRIPYGNFTKIESLLESINKTFKSIDRYEGNDYLRIAREPFLTIEVQNLKPILNVGRGDIVTLSFELASLLRLATAEDAVTTDLGTVSFPGESLNNIQDYKFLIATSQHSKHFKSYYADGVPSIKSTSNIFIYTNIVSNEIVGNQTVPLLRTIRCTGEFGNDIKEVFTTPYYKKIKKTEIHEIEIKICDTAGELVKFEYGTVFLVLHFRETEKK